MCRNSDNRWKCRYCDTMTSFDYLSTRETAQRLGLSTRTVLRLVDRGRLYPAARIEAGRRGTFVFTPEEVERVREQREAGIK